MSEKIRMLTDPKSRGMFQGKSKDVSIKSDTTLEFRFTDRLTVFDVKKPNHIPYKGAALAQTAGYMFNLARDLGLETHFMGMTGPNSMLARRFDLAIGSNAVDRRNTFIPLEFIVRNYVEGSLWRAVQSKAAGHGDLGFEAGHEIRRGDKLPAPRFEMWTKLEDVDRLLSHEEALKIGGISEQTVDKIREVVFMLNDGIQKRIGDTSKIKAEGGGESHLIRVDGKVELALGYNRNPVLVDSFGNPDEDRYWESRDYGAGRLVDMSKEFVRRYYMDIGYHGELTAAREKNKELGRRGTPLLAEPELPLLPPEMVKRTSELYIGMFERLTGRRFVQEAYQELSPLRRE